MSEEVWVLALTGNEQQRAGGKGKRRQDLAREAGKMSEVASMDESTESTASTTEGKVREHCTASTAYKWAARFICQAIASWPGLGIH